MVNSRRIQNILVRSQVSFIVVTLKHQLSIYLLIHTSLYVWRESRKMELNDPEEGRKQRQNFWWQAKHAGYILTYFSLREHF